MSQYDADCLAGRSTCAAPSQKSHAGHNVLDCGVELSGDGFRLSEGGDSACIPRSFQRCIPALGCATLGRSTPVYNWLCALERAASEALLTQA